MGLENFTIEEFIENYTPKIVSLYERPYDEGIYQTVAEDLTTGVQFDFKFADDGSIWFSGEEGGYFSPDDYYKITNDPTFIDKTWDAIDRMNNDGETPDDWYSDDYDKLGL